MLGTLRVLGSLQPNPEIVIISLGNSSGRGDGNRQWAESGEENGE